VVEGMVKKIGVGASIVSGGKKWRRVWRDFGSGGGALEDEGQR